jgi:hypothetical protein
MSRRTGRPTTLDYRVHQWVVAVYFGRFATQVELAAFLKVSQSTVHRIVSGFHAQREAKP